MALGSVQRTVDALVTGAGRRLAATTPAAERWLLVARDRYARAYVAATRLRNRLRYDAPPDPYRLVHVDPADVQGMVGRDRPMYRAAGVVEDGDWDRVDERFDDTDVYRAYRAHFEDGVPWRDTAFYDRILDELDSGRVRWGCSTRAEFDARCERLDDLYEAIASDGFRSQAALAGDGGGTLGEPSRLPTERRKREVAVHVGRDGAVLFADGRNRLSIAKLLGLDSVPVRVLRRHADWQATRDAVARGEAVDADSDHPDLPDGAGDGSGTGGG
ncbi:ParB N-terminal domain-containing protein [Halobacterium jilantaiense]|uniref:ParB-like nuclease domain-containing protein n=1 Tax=Halobacterium jilantaiense TaxID=355548 RepID=A0A1I0MQZ2_9EURY|nr:hypothetical protein [Halobacterium jilantaiense]SEV90716.1 hypothetical protein SAMN04487945_0278 [Halobacterium jilantaiense]